MKILMMVLMVGLMGCDGASYIRGERVALLGADDVNLVETYSSVDCAVDKRVFAIGGTRPDGSNYHITYIDSAGHFYITFDVYDIDTGHFVRSISIDSAYYEYAEFISIDNL
tara:strand:+ start:21 stop:356 length:336 start_codon:yes stop_codon:yes gene_type:complete